MKEKFESFFEKISPMINKISTNRFLQGLSGGMMATLPITVVGSFALLLVVVPLGPISTFIQNSGLSKVFNTVYTYTMGLLAVYMVFFIAKNLANQYLKNDDGMTAAAIAFLSFLIVTPLGETADEVTAIPTTWLGAQGAFTAIIVASVSVAIYRYCKVHHLTIKMPEGVPPMVSESFEPIFVSMIIVAFAFLVRVGFGYTPYGSFVNFFDQTIGAFIIKIGLSLPTIFLLYFAANLLWFFGIHPNTVYSAFVPLQMTLVLTNIADAQAGRPLTYLTLTLVSLFASFGGNGNTIGLCLSMFTAKSERYKKMLKLAFIPNLFNINEPLIFGMPVMLNPIFFIPMVFCNVVMGLIGLAATHIFTFTYNPAMSLLPWTTPFFVKAFMAGGISLLIMVLILLAVNTLMYYPFFKIADKKAYEEEQLAKAGGNIESIE